MPGWKKLEKVYIDEFGKKPVEQRPILAALIITDGEALDTDQFANALNQIKGRVFVTLAIIGFGKEHDVAVEAYKKIEAVNDHVKVVSLDSQTNPETIASTLLDLLNG